MFAVADQAFRPSVAPKRTSTPRLCRLGAGTTVQEQRLAVVESVQDAVVWASIGFLLFRIGTPQAASEIRSQPLREPKYHHGLEHVRAICCGGPFLQLVVPRGEKLGRVPLPIGGGSAE